ncbi:MAG: chromosome segregation protein SMC, partial [Clostridia bacterium]|nr:chromosome segregation protein SMC [Clostridia bacterium]
SKKDAELTDKGAELDALREKESELLSQLNANREFLDSLKRLEEHFEGYNHSVRYLMRAYEENRLNTNGGEIFGPVSRLIDVPKAYTVAVETALGAGLQNIVVDNEETAKLCIRELKNAGAGRATFYPITSVKPTSASQELKNAANFKGYINTADKLISYDGKFANIISSLLGRTAVFDNLDNATAASRSLRYTVRMVTLDGQQINVGGSFTGGSAKRDSGMLTRNTKIADLAKQIEGMTADRETLHQKLLAVKAEIDALTTEKNLMADTARITETLRHSEEIQSESLKTQLGVSQNLLSGLVSDSEALESHREKSSGDIEKLTESMESIRAEIELISEKRQALDGKRYELAEAIDTLSDEIATHRIHTAEHKKDIEAMQVAILDANERYHATEEQLVQKNQRIVYLNESINNSSRSSDTNREQYASESAKLEKLEAERSRMEADGMELERKLNELRLKIREVTARKETVLLSHSKNENKLEQLKADFDKTVSHLWDEYEITHAEALELNYPAVTAKNRGEVASALAEYKRKIKALGPINVDAIEEYKTVKERYDVLSTQMNDLTQAKGELIKAIATLEVDMKDSFVTAFNAINLNFNEVFRELFGGGHAEVSLTDPENVLECGIEIKAAPPGKVIKSLMLLSGGEQAFVAIALLFAILKVNPTPFCIFDEIEAALDDVNVVRFGNYIKKYSDQTQFIVITHRRGTMEVADTLYGVTMPQHGVSRVLMMDVNDVGKAKILE